MNDPAFTRHVRELWPDSIALFEIEDAVDGLLVHPGWVAVQDILALEIALVDSKLDGAREPLTQAEYALEHGRRDGLRGAQRALMAIIARSESERDRLNVDAGTEPAGRR